MLCSIFLISWPLNLGPIRRLKISVMNYHSTLRNIPQYHRSHKTFWWCRPWFGSTRSGSERSGLARSGPAFHTRIYDLIYLSTKFQGKKPHVHLSKYGINMYCVIICVENVTRHLQSCIQLDKCSWVCGRLGVGVAIADPHWGRWGCPHATGYYDPDASRLQLGDSRHGSRTPVGTLTKSSAHCPSHSLECEQCNR